MFEHLLVPLDGSSLAECVLPHGLAMARVLGARLTLLQVVEQPKAGGGTRAVDMARMALQRGPGRRLPRGGGRAPAPRRPARRQGDAAGRPGRTSDRARPGRECRVDRALVARPQRPVRVSCTGTVRITGTGSITLSDATLSGTGAVTVYGSASLTLADATLSGAGTVYNPATGPGERTINYMETRGELAMPERATLYMPTREDVIIDG